MKNLLEKELRLATSPLAWLFLAFSAMVMIPGYPILMGCFFLCLGLFQSFQAARESSDILYTTLLPVRKGDAVKAKYIAVCFFELLDLILMAGFTALRMTVFSRSPVYETNVMMSPNPVFLAFAAWIFTLFNAIFVGGFFRTAYKIGKPFVFFIVASMLTIGVAETLHHIPALRFLHAPGGERMGLQWTVLALTLLLCVAVTLLSEKRAERRFAQIDL
ncbi:MAG: ABC-2 transporter permease [Oscillospiraceae bacterium]|nr:ABC-2 transporter permease [Oscillospiraceae bacterium]